MVAVGIKPTAAAVSVKMIDKQRKHWTQKRKVKSESLIGGNKVYRNWPKERNLKHSTQIFTPKRKHSVN